jgi:nitroreductase
MNVADALKQRRSIRAYLDQALEVEKIIHILEHAKRAPSGINMQPFKVHVVQGESKKKIEKRMLHAFDHQEKEKMDYQYYPLAWQEPYKSRRKAVGKQIYQLLDIKREDHAKQKAQWRANYQAFGAPVVLYCFIDANLERGSYLDYGIFLQSVMLMATQIGLGSTPMASLAEFPSIVREELGIASQSHLLCGIALGYIDHDAPINHLRTPRIDLEEFTTFHP